IGLILAAGACLAVLLAAPATAQESSAMKQVGMVRTGAGTFTMDVEGADLRTVLKAVAEFSGRNIVVGKDVKASVHVSLRNVAWEDALRQILRSNGLDYVEEGGILRVDDALRLNSEANEREAAHAKQQELVPLEITAKLVDVDAEALRGLGIEWNVGPATPEFWAGIDDPANPGQKILPGGGALHNGNHTVNAAGEHNTPVSDPATRVTFGIFKN